MTGLICGFAGFVLGAPVFLLVGIAIGRDIGDGRRHFHPSLPAPASQPSEELRSEKLPSL